MKTSKRYEAQVSAFYHERFHTDKKKIKTLEFAKFNLNPNIIILKFYSNKDRIHTSKVCRKKDVLETSLTNFHR